MTFAVPPPFDTSQFNLQSVPGTAPPAVGQAAPVQVPVNMQSVQMVGMPVQPQPTVGQQVIYARTQQVLVVLFSKYMSPLPKLLSVRF